MGKRLDQTPATTLIVDAIERAGIPRHLLEERRIGRLHYATVGSTTMMHGWKLHVSSRAERYAQLVSKLLADADVRAVPFKLAADLETVDLINGGLAGDTQVGKVVTFYPESDAAARVLGERLAGMLRGWPGPVVENELRIEPSAPVFARYGSFQRRVHRTRLGLQMDVIESSNGELVHDRRGVPLHEAFGVESPFHEATLTSAPSVVGERFVLVGLMVETLHSKIFHAVDLTDCDDCLVKLVRRHTSVARSGRDAADRLRSEYELVTALQMPALTQARGFYMGEDWAALAMTRIEGRDLIAWRRAAPRDAATLRAVAAKVLSVLLALHERGVTVGDINSRNIIVSDVLDVHFVDLEFAARGDEESDAVEFGTHGHRAPELAAGAPLAPRHDLYALAAVLFYLVSGVEAWAVPRSDLLLREFGDQLPEPWSTAHALLLSDTLPSTVATLREVHAQLESGGRREAQRIVAPASVLRFTRTLDRSDLKAHLERTGRALLRLAAPDAEGHLFWISRHPTTRGQHYDDLHLGDAGIALALLRIGLALESVELIEAALDAACGIGRRLTSVAHPALPGLFIGDGGAVLSFLSLHAVLGSPDWLEQAVAVSRQLATLPCPSPDLLHGEAGRGLLQLWTYEATRDRRDLDAALASAAALAATVSSDSGHAGWIIPDGYGDLGGQQFYGMAHGTAGIVYFLNELLRVDPSAPVAALLDRALDGLTCGRAINPRIDAPDWLHAPRGEFRGGVWCHGAAGVAQAFARVFERTQNPEFSALAIEAARAAWLQAPWLGPTQCHGLAGLIEVLLDLRRATGEERFVASARTLGAHLIRYYTEDTEFGPLTSSERPDVFTAEFMVGAAGAAASLARLVDVDRWGSLLLPPHEAFRPHRRA